MSYHALEDFVEDCVRLIAATELPAADKRRLFYALYRLQNAFDCSYTVLRCFDELAQCGFICKLPLSQHPDYQQHADDFAAKTSQGSAWLAADAAYPEQESVFAAAENGEIFIFPQFGSRLWARLCADGVITEACEAPAALPLAELIKQLLQLAHAHGAEKLMKESYLLLFACWREGIPAAEALPADFDAWLNHPALLAIRRYAVEHQLLNLRSNATAFERPSLRDALYDAATPDEAAIIRFLLDLKTTPEAIAAKRAKEQLNQQQTAEKTAFTEAFLQAKMQEAGWHFVSATQTRHLDTDWTWYRDNAAQQRLLLTLSLSHKGKSLNARLVMQHPLLLQWQQRAPGSDINDFHFREFTESLLPVPQNQCGRYSGWHYDLSKSTTLLQQKLRDIIAHSHAALPLFEAKIERYFPHDFFSRTTEQYLELFDTIDEAPDFLIIPSLENILLLLIYRAAQADDFDRTQTLIALFEQRFPQLKRSKSRYQAQLQPFFEAVSAGRSAPLPPFGSGIYMDG